MSNKIFLIVSLILAITVSTIHSEQENYSTDSSITDTQAVQKAKQLISGTVTKTESTTHNGINVWEVYMTTESGGQIKIKYRVDHGTMVEMKGTSPSFEYEVQPGMNLIDYSNAKAVALNTRNGVISEWKLEKDDSDNRWEYRFFIRSAGRESEIRIDAASGVVLRIK